MQKIEFKELIDNYSDTVLKTAARILGDIQQAQDVHQEVFLEIWRRWHKYNGQTNWDAYLYRTTVRTAIKFARNSRAGQSIVRQSHEGHLTAEYAESPDMPDEPLRTAELRQKLAASLEKLPKRQAEVFVLSRMEGVSAEKIAEILGCSQKTVRVHLHRATRKLARQMSDYLIE
ncbi:MAG: sigma-70 family RNA polymerase sigma factor [Sedimentisphaerales bacterium]|nr:sigma-70 family RNA polymerase sigma factor [Sedimentisphaerales bacterium]